MFNNHAYPDEEIDKILQSFKDKGVVFKNDILNGEYIENDIRLSEAIREAIEEIKLTQRINNSKSAEIEKKKFLEKYYQTAELIGVSLTVEHLLPCLIELFKQDNDKGYTKVIFKPENFEKMIDFLASSSITVGYNGLRD